MVGWSSSVELPLCCGLLRCGSRARRQPDFIDRATLTQLAQGKVDPARRAYPAIFGEMLAHREVRGVGAAAVGLGQASVLSAGLRLLANASAVWPTALTHQHRPSARCPPPTPQQELLARNFSLTILGKAAGPSDSSLVTIPPSLLADGLVRHYEYLPFQVRAKGGG